VTVDAVLKVGGSLLAGERLGPLLDALESSASTERIVVVPGGGPFADAVREADRLHAPGAAAAHWMAILAMDQHAHLLAGLLPSAGLATDAATVERAIGAGRVAILAPYTWLRAADPLPHGWDVTSDSIAAWVAGQLGARHLVLLKAMDGVTDERGEVRTEVDPGALVVQGIVDEHFPRALDPEIECWIVSGRHPERLGELLRSGRTRGTRVCRGPGSRAAPARASR
jgi:5-(aminomethyl)-3-furanmethanol phosphate kinase